MADNVRRRLLVPEVSAHLRCGTERVLRLIRAGELRAINVGTGSKRPRWVIDAADLEEFERKRANAPAVVKIESRRQRREQVPNYFA